MSEDNKLDLYWAIIGEVGKTQTYLIFGESEDDVLAYMVECGILAEDDYRHCICPLSDDFEIVVAMKLSPSKLVTSRKQLKPKHNRIYWSPALWEYGTLIIREKENPCPTDQKKTTTVPSQSDKQ